MAKSNLQIQRLYSLQYGMYCAGDNGNDDDNDDNEDNNKVQYDSHLKLNYEVVNFL